jgi:hypothetical protein
MLFWDVEVTAPAASRSTLRAKATFAIVMLSSASAVAQQQVLTQSVITQEAQDEQATLCQGQGYPIEWTWAPNQTHHNPGSATSGSPQVVQMRNGVAIATYTNFGGNGPNCTFKGDGTDWQNPGPPAASGCGAFARGHAWRLWAPGDVFLVSAAAYNGPNQQPYLAGQYDGPQQYGNNQLTAMENITIRGVVQNNLRPAIYLNTLASDNTLNQAPVYFGPSSGVKWSEINVIGQAGLSVGKSGVYMDGTHDLRFTRSRVSGFLQTSGSGNGIFATGDNTGFLILGELELDHNGGQNGPEHNAYINASLFDPNYTVTFQHSWSHDAYYGHLFKSRAQNTVVSGDYLQGGLPQNGQTQAEAYLLDVPNGGGLTVRNTVFVKNKSGTFSNGFSIVYGEEGTQNGGPFPRVNNINIQNNTFVSLTNLFDGSHPTYPFGFFYPFVVPGSSGWPANTPYTIQYNAFAGYCPTGYQVDDYRGDLSLSVGIQKEVQQDYVLSTTPVYTDQTNAIVGLSDYGHVSQPYVRRKQPTVGARD